MYDKTTGLFDHCGRKNVRYYLADGTYKDHGRMIYKSIPQKGDIIRPFCGITGEIAYKVVDVRFPANDTCMEIYYKELP
jgi:hypothetical protein